MGLDDKRDAILAEEAAKRREIRRHRRLISLSGYQFQSVLAGKLKLGPRIMPEDAELIMFRDEWTMNPPTIMLMIQSGTFPAVLDGDQCPHSMLGLEIREDGPNIMDLVEGEPGV